MKTKIIFYIFLMVLVVTNSNAYEKVPVAISPSSESGIAVVRQRCPTFSWSAVLWAEAYRIIVFKAVSDDVLAYEEMDAVGFAVINKEIRGPALSWTPSEDESLSNGEAYVWYVQAVDAYGVGIWSVGKMFKVDVPVGLAGIAERAKESLREDEVSEELITDIFRDVKPEIKEKFLKGKEKRESGEYTPGITGIQGYEGSTNTFYGEDAGEKTTGKYNSFFGKNAGNKTTTGKSNSFFGYGTGYKNKTGWYNTFLGDRAGYGNTTGWWNTFIGFQAGGSNTTGKHNNFIGGTAGMLNTTGIANNFFGWLAGGSNKSGSFNTFLGNMAGMLNTTGDANTFLGNEAGNSNTTGEYNTFTGEGAGWSNTTGSYNTFLGIVAGYKNTTGKYNTFLGDRAGYYNKTGGYNTFIGSNTGAFNTTGKYNSFLGNKAGINNTTGRYNTFIGNGAGFKNTKGENNIFIGDEAGYKNTNGENNTFIGNKAGYKNTRGKSNVFLGFKAGYNETGSNKLYIDNSATKTPLISGSFDKNIVTINGKLGVGKSPANLIDVTGGAYCNGTTWVNASSREYKEKIESLNAEEAMDALSGLRPVKFNYKRDKEEEHVGFIAEEVPDLVATKDRKGMSAMDVVAVLTKVVQGQQEIILELKDRITELEKEK